MSQSLSGSEPKAESLSLPKIMQALRCVDLLLALVAACQQQAGEAGQSVTAEEAS